MRISLKRNDTLRTKWGTAKIDKNIGYYYISSREEGNNNKKLHRLIYEENFGAIPKGFHIHHKDNNKWNNCIFNLEMLSHSSHTILHHTGSKQTLKTKIKMSKSQNTTGYFRVSKVNSKKYSQGFIYSYQYYDGANQKRIQSTNLSKLEKKVKQKKLEWFKLSDIDEC